jgi:hypothetical protein
LFHSALAAATARRRTAAHLVAVRQHSLVRRVFEAWKRARETEGVGRWLRGKVRADRVGRVWCVHREREREKERERTT